MSRHKRSRFSKLIVVAVSVVLTLAVVVIALNLAIGEKQITEEVRRLYSIDDPQFARTMGVALGPAIVGGNRFRALQNGNEIFPAMLAAIRGAAKTITFETYIYWSDEIGREFAEALAERAKAGVKVHVMIDWVGSSQIDPRFLEVMEAAGVEVQKFHALQWYNLRRFNNRTHRKVLVVDGRIGFTGGVGIAGIWTGRAQDPEHWRDSHYSVEGPAARGMQAVFMDNWVKTTGKVLHGEEYFPDVPPAGNGAAQVFSSSPSGGSESMKLMYLLAITAAKRSINLSSAYFVPDTIAQNALVDAIKRGVRVRIITPGAHMDQETVRRASRARWGELLAAGAEMYEYMPTMYHCKIMIVDEHFVTVGSTNFDPRSFELNDEANLNIFDSAFAREQISVFDKDVALSRRMAHAQWQDRPLAEKLWERAASLLGPLL
ncbi:MAG: cardiolipin synthase B [Betaproteobacteria bacterium]|nr:cardiolipin synthase B [Betaproteobacteria bacterium]